MRSSLRRCSAYAGVLAFACSVYDAPDTASDASDNITAETPAGDGGSNNEAPGGTTATAGSTTAGTSTDPSGTGGMSTGNSGGTAGGSVAVPPDTVDGGAGPVDAMGGANDAGTGVSTPPADECPNDPDKSAPGTCGCGIPDKSTSKMTDCRTLKSKLAHRYDFEGSGTAVEDRIGTADGVVKGATLSKLDGNGVVLLGGGSSGAYVDLPNKLLSTQTSATLEAWITWGGGNNWQRVFDFGDSNAATPEDNPALGKTYLFLTPKSSGNVAAATFSTDGWSKELHVEATVALSMSITHVAVVADAASDKLALYIDGKHAGEQPWTGTLASINDVNVWLGRSQYDSDPEFSGVFHEFRIYTGALTDADIAASFAGGTDPAFLAY